MSESRQITLPAWQDDSLVSACPLCSRRFHFLFRKHHCRRCGRVVCDTCSPHRITIPSQYIVRPPYDLSKYRITAADDLWADPSASVGTEISASDRRHRAEIVRVCKPCTPDPNYAPPPDLSAGPGLREARDFTSPQRSPERQCPDRYRATYGTVQPRRGDRTATRRTSSSALGDGASGRHRERAAPGSAANWTNPSRAPAPDQPTPNIPTEQAATTPGTPTRPRPMQLGIRSRASRVPSGSAPTHSHVSSINYTNNRISSQRQRRRRRHEDESSECPVCGTHEPPFGNDDDYDNEHDDHEDDHAHDGRNDYDDDDHNEADTNDHDQQRRQRARQQRRRQRQQQRNQMNETAREQHIQACLDAHVAHFSTPPSSNRPIASGPEAGSVGSRSPSGVGDTAVQASTPTPRGPGSYSSAAASRVRAGTASSTQPQRMLSYLATEKDCIDPDAATDDGLGASGSDNRVECVICFEEFEPGDQMARLECLCKFHKACIKAWWESGSRVSAGPGAAAVGGAASGSGTGRVVVGSTGSAWGGFPAAAVGTGLVGLRALPSTRWGTCPTHTLHD